MHVKNIRTGYKILKPKDPISEIPDPNQIEYSNA